MGKEIELPSGNKATLQDAAFGDVIELQEYIAKNLGNIPAEAFGKGMATDVASVIKFIPSLIENKEARRIVLACGKKCYIAGKSFGGNLSIEYFEAPEHRVDYYPLLKEVAEYALAPLLKGISAVKLPDMIKKLIS